MDKDEAGNGHGLRFALRTFTHKMSSIYDVPVQTIICRAAIPSFQMKKFCDAGSNCRAFLAMKIRLQGSGKNPLDLFGISSSHM